MEPTLSELETRRSQLYADLAATGDFRRGTLTATYRRCGKANCVCADPEHPGHGPRHLLTRSMAGKTVARQLAPGPELAKVGREVAAWQHFRTLVSEVSEVNEAICESRPVSPLAAGGSSRESQSGAGPERGGSSARSRRSSPPR